MTEFTAEQEAEIQKRIEAAKAEQKQFEQYRIAGDQFYRMALANMAMLVNNGTCNAYVHEVGKNEYAKFLETFFPNAAQPAEQTPAAGADDDGTKE